MPHFVKKFDINGVKTKQVACIELHGRPNAATKGAVGVLGMDVDSPTHEIYKCVGVMGGIYVWEVFSGGSGGSGGSLTVVDGGHYTPSVTDNGNGTMTISFTASKDGMAVVAPVTVTLPAGADGAHVVAIDEMGGDDTKTTYKMRFSDGSGYDFDVYHGQDGEDGTDGGHYTPSVTDNGNGTMTVSFTASTSDMPTINPVTITLPVPDDGENGGYYTPSVDTVTANTFKISFTASKSGMPAVGDVTITLPAAKDGNDGDDGVGIESVVQTTTSTVDGGENVITVTLTNGNKSTFKVKNGPKGSKGDAGNGIKSIAKTSTSGLVDTYTITFTDGSTTTFTVTNGKDGDDEEAIASAVTAWMDAHPEATTTVTDGSVSPKKTTFLSQIGNGDTETIVTPDFTPIEESEGFAWESGKTLNGSLGAGVTVGDKTNSVLSPYIPVALGKMLRVKGMSHTTANRTSFKIAMFNAEKVAAGLSPVCPAAPRSAGTGCLEAQDPTEFSDGIARYKVGYTVSPSNPGVVGSTDFIPGTQSAIAYIRICGIPAGAVEDITISIDETISYTTQVIEYEGTYQLDPNIKVPDAEEAMQIAKETAERMAGIVSDAPDIFLPSDLYLATGLQGNFYYRNIVFSSRAHGSYDMRASISNADGTSVSNGLTVLNIPDLDLFRITATAAQAGDYLLKFELKDFMTGAVAFSKTVNLHIVENTKFSPSSPKKVLIMGDSVTASNGHLYTAEIQHTLAEGGIVSVGTRQGTTAYNEIGDVKGEGYDGAAIYTRNGAGTYIGFTQEYVVSGTKNPLWNASTGKVDIANYLATIGETTLDAVCINLGLNSLGANNLATQGLASMIASIREYSTTIPIIISLCTQLATGPYFAGDVHLWRRYWRSLNNAIKDVYDNGAVSGVYLSSPYLNIDGTSDDYGGSSDDVIVEPKTAWDSGTITRLKDNYHPAKKGLCKIAVPYYSALLYALKQ